MTVEELRFKTIDLMSDPNMPVSLEYATELIGDLIAAAREEGAEEAKPEFVHCGECERRLGWPIHCERDLLCRNVEFNDFCCWGRPMSPEHRAMMPEWMMVDPLLSPAPKEAT